MIIKFVCVSKKIIKECVCVYVLCGNVENEAEHSTNHTHTAGESWDKGVITRWTTAVFNQ